MLVGWAMHRAGFPRVGMALAGATAMTLGFAVGVAVIRSLFARMSGVAGVAGAVVDEAVRMRSVMALAVVFVGLVPALPLLVDPTERLAYRVQFLIAWTLGVSGVILSLLTVLLACGSVCGDIESGRIHMTLSKPLRRWEYLVGKWLGILLVDLLLVALAGGGTYVLVRMLAAGPATDAADRQAVDRQVLVARRAVGPRPDRPEEYEAAIAAAIDRLQIDEPDAFRQRPDAVRRRIRREYESQWHTVTPDMETTFLFPGVDGGGAGGEPVQLQVEPRVSNVDVDLADVRFVMWINGRPWPLADGRQVEITLPSRVRHVFGIPSSLVTGAEDLRVRIANRNLVPPGETRATAITFPPGDGMKVLVPVGGFETNFVRCLLIMWAKLGLLAAVGVAAGATLDLPLAILATLVVSIASFGGAFISEAMGTYNVVGDTALGRAAERIAYTIQFIRAGRLYEAFRMLAGFLTDGVLAVLPSSNADAAVAQLAAGMAIPWRDVIARLLVCIGVYPAVVGSLAWLVFDRRDLVRTS
jgi:ABC-type transport system involved in multi-copper enzyme maturation permease subunit